MTPGSDALTRLIGDLRPPAEQVVGRFGERAARIGAAIEGAAQLRTAQALRVAVARATAGDTLDVACRPAAEAAALSGADVWHDSMEPTR